MIAFFLRVRDVARGQKHASTGMESQCKPSLVRRDLLQLNAFVLFRTSRPLWTINSSTRMKSANADQPRPHKSAHPLRPHPSVSAPSSAAYPYGNVNSSHVPLSSAVSAVSKPWTQNASPLNYSFDIGPQGLDWQLAQPAMASSLTRHLLDGTLVGLFVRAQLN